MEEQYLSGYCRQTDAPRTVIAEFTLQGGNLSFDCADCHYPKCQFADNCEIAISIRKNADA